MKEEDAGFLERSETTEYKNKKSIVLFVCLLLLYGIASVFTPVVSRSAVTIMLGESRMPISAFTGVISSLANICIIFIVVYFGKQGFVTALTLIAVQFPLLIISLIAGKNLNGIPGVFVNLLTIVAIVLIYKRNKKIESFQTIKLSYLKDQQKYSQRLFEQTATALVNAIDAKDTYSRGHSVRVAEYSRKIAEAMGKDEDECYKIYYTALLHDVGKIGISDDIINKKGKLTDEEYEVIKSHPVLGYQILNGISEYPYLSIGAHHHHERYDGKGYPDKLKGDDIPEIARIIAVADAYDAMTSTRSYRKAISQQHVREEIVKNAGTQFDPNIAKIMQHIIDLDTEFEMKERDTVQELDGKNELNCVKYRSEISEGILITPYPSSIELDYISEEKHVKKTDAPSFVLFDSLDGRVHTDDIMIREMNYFEYGEISFCGKHVCHGARKIHTNSIPSEDGSGARRRQQMTGVKHYVVDAMRQKDHALITIDDGTKVIEFIIALPDNTRYLYLGLTGENCIINNVKISKSETRIAKDAIPRIAEEVTFIDGPQGDIPNVQIDGYRSDATDGIPITDGLQVRFHTKSLPTARLIWHCPYVSIFTSKDRKVNGEGYREYALIRLDGENWHGEGNAENKLVVNRSDAFVNWDVWKKENKEGFECLVTFERHDNVVIIKTENQGVILKNTTTVLDGNTEIFFSLSGDQCALTNIRISGGKEE